jgi:prepilin-type N-terminal cleavage/methylation domain-containing protein
MRASVAEGDAGVTLVELAVAMMISAMLSAVMVAWMTAGVNSERTHQSYDRALSDLRAVADQLSREVRGATRITDAGESSVSFWLDVDRDGATDSGEIVTWSIDGPDMVRATDAGDAGILATTLSAADSGFTYDSDNPDEIKRVTITLGTVADNGSNHDLLQQSMDIYLRNM